MHFETGFVGEVPGMLWGTEHVSDWVTEGLCL